MNLATVEKVVAVEHHPNADKLDIIKVLGYDCIVGRDQYKVGDLVVFVQPDSILPNDRTWCQDLLRYTSKGRIRAVRLRGEWSMGLVVSFDDAYEGINAIGDTWREGADYTDELGITKYEPALPNNTQARGGLPYFIPKTDETRWQNVRDLDKLFGQQVDVTLKIDGSSATYYCVLANHPLNITGETQVGICSRSLELKVGEDEKGQVFQSKWHEAEKRYDILARLRNYCEEQGVSLALRGEIFGSNIQDFAHNPHAGGEVDFALYGVYDMDAYKYTRIHDKHYFAAVAGMLNIPCVPILETGFGGSLTLTKDLIDKYDHQIKSIKFQGKFYNRFEGVVINHANGSFKVINKWYDSEKE